MSKITTYTHKAQLISVKTNGFHIWQEWLWITLNSALSTVLTEGKRGLVCSLSREKKKQLVVFGFINNLYWSGSYIERANSQ